VPVVGSAAGLKAWWTRLSKRAKLTRMASGRMQGALLDVVEGGIATPDTTGLGDEVRPTALLGIAMRAATDRFGAVLVGGEQALAALRDYGEICAAYEQDELERKKIQAGSEEQRRQAGRPGDM
jgi:hypothetical protein